MQANDKPAVNTQILKQHPSHATRFTNAYVSRGTGTPVPAETRVKLEKLSYKKNPEEQRQRAMQPQPQTHSLFQSHFLYSLQLPFYPGRKEESFEERETFDTAPTSGKGLVFFFFYVTKVFPFLSSRLHGDPALPAPSETQVSRLAGWSIPCGLQLRSAFFAKLPQLTPSFGAFISRRQKEEKRRDPRRGR